ncbi:MAG: diacylglycerol kinase family protein [Clostridia bacterium]
MKHLFIVNPVAGGEDVTERLTHELARFPQLDATIYRSTHPGDATDYVRAYCRMHKAPLRFCACGGDGTLNEVVNGAVGFAHASVACYPCGSGNDYVKYYGGKAPFLDIASLLDAREVPVDLIRVGDRYAINACHFGFDSTVARLIPKYKRWALLGSKRAYPAAVLTAFVTSMNNRASLTLDGKPFYDGAFLLCTIANGTYVGGSYKCAPYAQDDDGLVEVCLIKRVSRFRFLRLLSAYKQGAHLSDPRFSDVLCYRRAKSVTIDGPDGFCVSLDGELLTQSHLTLSVLPGAIQFAVPAVLLAKAQTTA